jgi:hypothetical protein
MNTVFSLEARRVAQRIFNPRGKILSRRSNVDPMGEIKNRPEGANSCFVKTGLRKKQA